MIDEAKMLISAFGLPVMDAPSEAEAQASLIVKNGDAFAIATNDADAMLFEAPRIVRNVSMAGRKKKANKLSYETIKPDLIVLEENLKHLGINQEQLIALAMLIGTDYNNGGIKGIGPKTALKLVKQYGNNFSALFSNAKWDEHFEFSWQEVFDLIKRKITINIELKGKGTAKPVSEIIEKYVRGKGWQYDDFLVSSFNRHELLEFSKLKPEIKIGLVTTKASLDLAVKIKAHSVNVRYDVVNEDFVSTAHKKRLMVFAWTVNNSKDIKRIKSCGVDGIFSDFPDRL